MTMVLEPASHEHYKVSLHEERTISISYGHRTYYTPFGIDRFLTLPDDVRPSGAETMETFLYWVRGFLALPHPFLGRPGPVCPFVPSLLQRQMMYVCIESDPPCGKALESHRQLNLQLMSSLSSPYANLSTVIALYPKAKLEDLERAQSEKHQHFLESGLMLGGLHKAVERKGLHNKNIVTRKSPIPLLACHAIFPGDLVFLAGQEPHFRAYQKCIEREQVPSALVTLYDSLERSYTKGPSGHSSRIL